MESENKSILWLPLQKTGTNKYSGILSDDSLDRDGEIIDKTLLMKWAGDIDKYIPGLIDHQNKVENLVAKLINPHIIKNETEDRYALAVEPIFFESNPKAKMVKGMLDEGANIGLSIGALPKSSEIRKMNNKDIKVWTDAELLEGSFTPIPANRNAFAVVAKSFKLEEEEISKYIKREGEEFVVYSEDGKVLGRHKTKEEALAQLRAVEANKKSFDEELEKKFEQTENEIRYRIREPDQFDKFRSKDLTSGVRAIFGRKKGSDKWEIQAIRFDKNKFTIEQARTWINEHKDIGKSINIEEENKMEDEQVKQLLEAIKSTSDAISNLKKEVDELKVKKSEEDEEEEKEDEEKEDKKLSRKEELKHITSEAVKSVDEKIIQKDEFSLRDLINLKYGNIGFVK